MPTAFFQLYISFVIHNNEVGDKSPEAVECKGGPCHEITRIPVRLHKS